MSGWLDELRDLIEEMDDAIDCLALVRVKTDLDFDQFPTEMRTPVRETLFRWEMAVQDLCMAAIKLTDLADVE